MGIKTRVRKCLREREHPFDYPDDTIDLLSRLYQNESASVIAQVLIDGYEHDRMDASWASSENNAATSNTSNATDTTTTETTDTTTTDSNATTKPDTKRKSNEDSMEEDSMEEDNNNEDSMEEDIDEDDDAATATVKNNDTKQRRVTNSPQKPASNQTTNTIPDLNNKLANLLHAIPSITEVALKDAGGTLGTTKKVTVGDKTLEVFDASKIFNSIKEGVKNNGLVRELAKEDLSGVVRSMIGKDNIINPNPNEKKSTEDCEDGTEGVGAVMSLGAPKVRDMTEQSRGKELVAPLQNLSISNSVEQDKVDVVGTVRTVVSQYKNRSKGRSTMLPKNVMDDVVRVLNGHIQSNQIKQNLRGIVLRLSRVFMCETVKMAKESDDFKRLDEDYQRLLNVFWNGYPSDASPLYKDGEDNAVDDRLCYKRSDEEEQMKKWEDWVEKEIKLEEEEFKLEEEEKEKWKVTSAKSTNEEEEDDDEEEDEEEEDDSDDEDSE